MTRRPTIRSLRPGRCLTFRAPPAALFNRRFHKVTDTALGTIRSVEHTIQHLEEVAETLTRNLTDTRKRLADTQAQVSTPFEYAERLTELVQRQQEIEDELDLTNNQASPQLGADSARETPITEPESDRLKEEYDDGF